MIKPITINAKIHNPFSDEWEYPIIEFSCHIDGKRKIDFVEVVSIVTDAQVEMVDYVSEKVKEELAIEFQEQHGDMI